MTQSEIRALLHRVNARQLRENADIEAVTVQQALGISRSAMSRYELGERLPVSAGGRRWAAFVAGLERRARVRAEIAATERRAA